MEVAFGGTLTESDALHALRRTGAGAAIGCFGAAAIACGLLALINIWNPGGQPFSWLALAGPLGVAAWVQWKAVRRGIRNDKTLVGPIDGALDDEGLTYNTQHSRSRWPWHVFKGYRHTQHGILLFFTEGKVLVIPRPAFRDDAEWQNACGLVVSHVSAQTDPGGLNWRRIFIWSIVLTVLFLAWHFAKTPGPRR